jgi:AraC-like DNA-binding protein
MFVIDGGNALRKAMGHGTARADTLSRMSRWEAEFDLRTRTFRHRVAPGFGHGLLMSAQTYVFEALGVSAALWLARSDWFPLHIEHGVPDFEVAPGIDSGRRSYNERSFATVKRSHATLLGEHNGLSDFFVPITREREIVAILVVGPFARHRPTAADIQDRWRSLTGRQGHPSDPHFAGYLSATLATIVLDSAALAALKRLLENWARLAIGDGDAGVLANAIERDRLVLNPARYADRVWNSVREMIDDRFTHLWQGRSVAPSLVYLGLPKVPDRILVGLMTSVREAVDPIEEVVTNNALQRAAVDFVRHDRALAGRIGDHGIVLVASTRGSEHQRTAQLRDLAWRVAAWARRKFAVSLHFGTGEAAEPTSLARRYQQSLAAAQSALFDRKSFVVLRAAPGAEPRSLENMRRTLDRMLAQTPDRLEADFDRYLEVVLSECGYRFETTRAHAEVGFERLVEALARQGVLDERDLVAIRTDLPRSVAVAGNLNELLDPYRRAVRNLARAARAPVRARHERSLERAIEHIEQHYAEPLRLDHVAHIAGFAPKYFSKLFVRSEGVPFGRYLTFKRVERAKELLTTTDFPLSRVARLTGWPTAGYLCTAFKRATGVTPTRWRARGDLRAQPGHHKRTTTLPKRNPRAGLTS